jgi:hypothetical protein
VVQRDHIEVLTDLIAKLADPRGPWDDIPGHFREIRQSAFTSTPESDPKTKAFTGKFMLESTTGAYKLIDKAGQLCIVSSKDQASAVQFIPLDADIARKNDPRPTMDLARTPLIASTNTS